MITSEQVARLEAALEAKKEQGDMELRKARHQLALAQAETHQAKQEGEKQAMVHRSCSLLGLGEED